MRPQGPQARTALPLECAFALRQQSGLLVPLDVAF